MPADDVDAGGGGEVRAVDVDEGGGGAAALDTGDDDGGGGADETAGASPRARDRRSSMRSRVSAHSVRESVRSLRSFTFR
jgi:hypothetical protein